MNKWILAALLFLGSHLQSDPFFAAPPPEPFLTGPLIAPQGTVIPYGDLMVQSYLYCTAVTGVYDKNREVISAPENFYSFTAQWQCFFGLTPWCDINIIPQLIYQTTSNQHSVHMGDLTVGLDFQLMDPDVTPYFPGIKLAVREVFPTGNFQYLSPRKYLTDETGAGTFATQFNLVLYQLFHLRGPHWLSMTVSGQYTVNTPVHVHGFNAYGGGFGTSGQVLPGNQFQGIVSFELTLDRHWALALDNVYTYTNSSSFFGMPGISFSGTFASVASPSSEQLSFAPAIEYNWSEHLGIIAGCWFTTWGRNSAEFRSGVINVEYTY